MLITFINNSADQLEGVCHQRLLQCFGVHETESHLHTYLESTCGSMLSELFSVHGKGAFEEGKLTQLINAVVYQTLEGLQFIHSVKKMVHNAITSDTILLSNTGSVKITGFGLCQSFSEYGAIGPGLKCYLNAGHHSFWHAPEIIRRESCVYQSDIWSLGCLILELCTRTRPSPWSTDPGIGFGSKSLNIGGLLESMKSSYPIHAKLVSTMVCEEAEKRDDAGGVLRKFKKSRPLSLNPTSTNIHDMITPASDMAKLDTLYASAYVGPPLRDSIAQNFQMPWSSASQKLLLSLHEKSFLVHFVFRRARYPRDYSHSRLLVVQRCTLGVTVGESC